MSEDPAFFDSTLDLIQCKSLLHPSQIIDVTELKDPFNNEKPVTFGGETAGFDIPKKTFLLKGFHSPIISYPQISG
jgi:hypothetical protein